MSALTRKRIYFFVRKILDVPRITVIKPSRFPFVWYVICLVNTDVIKSYDAQYPPLWVMFWLTSHSLAALLDHIVIYYNILSRHTHWIYCPTWLGRALQLLQTISGSQRLLNCGSHHLLSLWPRWCLPVSSRQQMHTHTQKRMWIMRRMPNGRKGWQSTSENSKTSPPLTNVSNHLGLRVVSTLLKGQKNTKTTTQQSNGGG